MSTNNFLLVDLNETKTKKLAETITSDTSRKILNYLAEKDDAEANIAQHLDIPISTVHYHLQKLQEAGLVKVDEFHYSQKGREINHYKLVNKYIIITPQKVSGLTEKLKGILPVVVIIVGLGLVIQLFYSNTLFITKTMVESAPRLMTDNLMAAAPQVASRNFTLNEFALGFVIGGIVTLGIYILINLIKEKTKK